jgi:hypothetical protein
MCVLVLCNNAATHIFFCHLFPICSAFLKLHNAHQRHNGPASFQQNKRYIFHQHRCQAGNASTHKVHVQICFTISRNFASHVHKISKQQNGHASKSNNVSLIHVFYFSNCAKAKVILSSLIN